MCLEQVVGAAKMLDADATMHWNINQIMLFFVYT